MTNRIEVIGSLPDMTLELPTGTLQVTQWPKVKPRPGRDLWSAYGVCAHPNFNNEAYGDTDAWTQKLADMGVYAFRGMAASQLDHVKRTLERAKELGLKWLATVASEKTTEAQLRANLAFVASNPEVFVAVEGINEPGPGDIAKTVRFQRIIWDFVQENDLDVVVLSPALRMKTTSEFYQQFVNAGILGTFHAVSLHHYNSGGPPDLAALRAHVDMVEDGWECDRFWVTETGYTNALESQDPRRAPEAASAAYSIPNVLEFLSDPRVEKVFRYELLDDDAPLANNEAHFGLWRVDGSPKPEVSAIRDFLSLTRGDDGFDPPDVEMEVVAPEGVRWQVRQSDGGPVVVLLWRPGVLHDAAPVDVQVLIPEGGEATHSVGGAAAAVLVTR